MQFLVECLYGNQCNLHENILNYKLPKVSTLKYSNTLLTLQSILMDYDMFVYNVGACSTLSRQWWFFLNDYFYISMACTSIVVWYDSFGLIAFVLSSSALDILVVQKCSFFVHKIFPIWKPTQKSCISKLKVSKPEKKNGF